jgi:DnaJ-class molecular chaperone
MAGDVLFITVFEPHPTFKRIGADLIMKNEIISPSKK